MIVDFVNWLTVRGKRLNKNLKLSHNPLIYLTLFRTCSDILHKKVNGIPLDQKVNNGKL